MSPRPSADLLPALLALALLFHGSVLWRWWSDRGESWTQVARRVERHLMAPHDEHELPPVVIFRSVDHIHTATATVHLPFVGLQVFYLAFLDAATRQDEAARLHTSAEQMLSSGQRILICPGVFEYLRRRGAGAVVETLLSGMSPVPADAERPDGFSWLRLKAR